MRYAAYLSGEHPELPEAELRAVLGAEDAGGEVVVRMGDVAVFESEGFDFSRLAMTKEVSRLVAELDEGGLEAAGELVEVDGSFAVRCVRVDDRDLGTSEYEGAVGASIQRETGGEVDLENPDTLFRVYIYENTFLLCEVVESIDRGGFEGRRSHLRPFSSPVSLHPRLARALVNLAGVTGGESVLDPFCGTGGILIEAGLMGMECFGLDLDEGMVEGAVRNLEACGVEGDVCVGDARRIGECFDRGFDVVVTDLPYGRSSRSSVEHEELVRGFLRSAVEVCGGRIVFVSNRGSVAGLEPMFELYVHRSLSRFVYVVEDAGELKL